MTLEECCYSLKRYNCSLITSTYDRFIFESYLSVYFEVYRHVCDPVASLMSDVIEDAIDNLTKNIIKSYDT